MQNQKAYYVPWTFKDMFKILLFQYFIISLEVVVNLFLFGQNPIAIFMGDIVRLCLMIFLPYVWLKRKYGSIKEKIGLQKSSFSCIFILIIGALSGVFVFIISYSLYQLLCSKQLSLQFLYSIFIGSSNFSLQLYLRIIPSVVLAPIAEEIFSRGIVYGYLKMKYGVLGGIMLQAVIFTIMHPSSYILLNPIRISSLLINGIVLGLLYNQTKNIYSSIISHSICNGLTLFFWPQY